MVGSFSGEISAPWKAQHVFGLELKGQVTAYSWMKGWSYYIQIKTNKEAGVLVYSWVRETGLANLGRSSLYKGPVFQATVDIFWTELTLALWPRRRLCHFHGASALLPHTPRRKLCFYPVGLKLWDPWHSSAYVNRTHSLRALLTQGLLHPLQPLMPVAISLVECRCEAFILFTRRRGQANHRKAHLKKQSHFAVILFF